MKAEKCYLHSQNFVEVFFKKGGGCGIKEKMWEEQRNFNVFLS